MKKLLSVFLSIGVLSGCTVVSNGSFIGIDPNTPEGVTDLVEKKFIGVPVLLGIEGSAVRLNKEWMLTAAHNDILVTEDMIKHPECDIALYRDFDDSHDQTPVGLVYPNQDTFMVGYPPAPLPITSQKGQYIGEVVNEGWDGDCVYSAITNTMVSGMSGGGVFNSNGELVGVTHALMNGQITWEDRTSHYRPAVFLPLLRVKDWLNGVTGENYYE